MKQQIRLLGIDDSPFKFGDGKALVVGTLVRVPNYLEGVMSTEVAVDGSDSTDRLLEMISGSRFKAQVKAIMIDGIALAGFNVIDIERLSKELDVPVLTITRDEPDFAKMKSALMKYFTDWETRYALVTKLELRKVETQHKPLFVCGIGADWDELVELIRLSTVRGVVPEPIRIAHLIAAGMVRGESYGRS